MLCNNAFGEKIINPVVCVANEVTDTGELFIRSIQLNNMTIDKKVTSTIKVVRKINNAKRISSNDMYSEMKVGTIASTFLKSLLESNKLPNGVIANLQLAEYSKKNFDLQFPLLKKVEQLSLKKTERYYADPVKIGSKLYYLCSEWYERKNNNDRPYLIKWIEENSG